jgi:protein O-GlcNAc transferase
MLDTARALAEATRHHQSGQLAEAEPIYRRILAIEPNNFHALHQLGMLELQTRRFESAVGLISRAIGIHGAQPAFHVNLGEAFRHLQKLDEAASCYRRAIAIAPNLAPAHAALGGVLHAQGKLTEAANELTDAMRLNPQDDFARARLGQVLSDQGKASEAEACFRRVLLTQSESAQAHFNLGGALQSQGRMDEAVTSYRTALARDPNFADAHNNLGAIYKSQKRLAEAVVEYQAALALRPDYAIARFNLGTVYAEQGKHPAAMAEYEAALCADPNMLQAKAALAMQLQRHGRPDEAWAMIQDVLQRDPGNAAAHVDAGNILHSRGQALEAIDEYQAALRIDPNYAYAYSNIAATLSEQGMRDEAIAYSTRALEIDPEFAIARGNLAVALQAVGRIDEAMAHHRRAVAQKPDDAGLGSNLLYLLNYDSAYDAATVFAEHRAWGARIADLITAQAPPHCNNRSPNRRLRVGYVSSHFMAHAVNFFIEPILRTHHHDAFEVFCYSNVGQPDATTERLQSYADHWRNIMGVSDQDASEMVRDDRIDILVDLAGHIGGTRLVAFAHKPAPVQVTYIGYQNTTGMLAMDYRLTDDYADPPGTTEQFHTEKLVRLSRSFFCYLPSDYAPPVCPSPALANGFVTFGSFNNFTKVMPPVLEAWGRILLAVPRSRLILLADMAPSLKSYLISTFEGHGVSAERLELANRRPREGYLELIQQADIALDPFPFNGHTTTCDALWQGVAVVTLSGTTYVSRFGGSGLATLGLGELIAHTADEYVQIAVGLGNDVNRLRDYRGTLRQRMSGSPLLVFEGFTRNLETAYRKMWVDWCERKTP